MFNIVYNHVKEERDEQEIMNIFNEYCKSKNLYRHNIRKCDLKPLSKLLNLSIVPLEYQ